jgi:NAD dependent epimerase/dehydratase family enzyme
MRVLVSGSSGLVGSELSNFLIRSGHEPVALRRSGAGSGNFWDFKNLEGFDAVVHLAGENIADKRWSEHQKIRIRDSRIKGTEALASALASLKNPQ